MSLDLIPENPHSRYRFLERGHACAILAKGFPNEFKDICDYLHWFVLKESDILKKGETYEDIIKRPRKNGAKK